LSNVRSYCIITSFLLALSASSSVYKWQPGVYAPLPVRYADAASHHNNNHILSTGGRTNGIINTKHSHSSVHFILICCGWNFQSTNKELTFSIIGGSAAERQAVKDAANEWMKSVKGLKLTLVAGNVATADITFGFQHSPVPGGKIIASKSSQGDTVGQTVTYFDGSGYISHALVTIATSAFGSNLNTDQLKQIAMHEIGHTLGLGHANFKGDLMSPRINDELHAISKCDISGIISTNQWEGSASGNVVAQYNPQEDRVSC